MAAGLGLILLPFVVGVHIRCLDWPVRDLDLMLHRRLWLVGHDLGLASDPEPGAVGAVTLQLHMPVAV
jgi:hypothetical protein